MPAPLLAVDAPFVLYRSFFALPDSITGPDGHPVNALLGSVNLLLRIAADRRPRAIVTCFGAEAAEYLRQTADVRPGRMDNPPVFASVPGVVAFYLGGDPARRETYGVVKPIPREPGPSASPTRTSPPLRKRP